MNSAVLPYWTIALHPRIYFDVFPQPLNIFTINHTNLFKYFEYSIADNNCEVYLYADGSSVLSFLLMLSTSILIIIKKEMFLRWENCTTFVLPILRKVWNLSSNPNLFALLPMTLPFFCCAWSEYLFRLN